MFPFMRDLRRPRLAAMTAGLLEELRDSSNIGMRALGAEDPKAVLAGLLGEESIGPGAADA